VTLRILGFVAIMGFALAPRTAIAVGRLLVIVYGLGLGPS
jgi:hypothetical protein